MRKGMKVSLYSFVEIFPQNFLGWNKKTRDCYVAVSVRNRYFPNAGVECFLVRHFFQQYAIELTT
jgi:hypothetical protein